jgi:hypothetical protein
MPEFLAETYAPRDAPGTATPSAAGAAAAGQASQDRAPVRFLGAILVPEEETCFWLYQAPSAAALRAAMTAARLRPDRITRPSQSRHTPLAAYRAAELAAMRRNFTGAREPYAQLRRAFLYKAKPTRTPPHLARHRTRPWPSRPGQSQAQAPSVLARQPGPRDSWSAAGRAGAREDAAAQAATPVPAATAAGLPTEGDQTWIPR